MNISEVKANNKAAGFHFFDRDTMRFFKSRIESTVYKNNRFITSEQAPHGPRMFTVRQYNPETHEVETVGEFMKYRGIEFARMATRSL